MSATIVIVKLANETVQAALSSWIVVAPCLTVNSQAPRFSLRSFRHHCTLWDPWVCCFLERETCWPFSTAPSQVFWQVGSRRGAGITLGTFRAPLSLEFCHLAYLGMGM